MVHSSYRRDRLARYERELSLSRKLPSPLTGRLHARDHGPRRESIPRLCRNYWERTNAKPSEIPGRSI
jgi:hypothetical protein